MTRIWWVRHAPTPAPGIIGWTDLPADLSDTAGLRRLAAHLPQAPVVSSDLARAVATADAIAVGRPRLPHDPDLRELHFGAWESLPYHAIQADRLIAFYDSPGDTRAPGGESWNDICARVGAAVDRLVAQHVGGDVIAVAHMGAILTQVQRALRIPARAAFGHRIDTLSVTCLRHDGTWQAEMVNHRP